MINKSNHKLRPGDKIYNIYWEPVNDKATWMFREYTIKDMYYSDRCYAVVEDIDGNTKEITIDDKDKYWLATEEEAHSAVVYQQNYPRAYAWGDRNIVKRSPRNYIHGIG